MRRKDSKQKMPRLLPDWIDKHKAGNAWIKAYTERWDIRLSNCETGVKLFNYLKTEFDKIYSEAYLKEEYRQEEIDKYSAYKNSDVTTNRDYIAKGYNWFGKRDFTLKDFLHFQQGTAHDKVSDTAKNPALDLSFARDEWMLLQDWQTQERRFKLCAEGWAYARYVYYVTNANTGSVNLTHSQRDSAAKLEKAIENNLSELKTEAFIDEEDYELAKSLIKDFFEKRTPQITSPIQIKNTNKKKLAFALGEIWRTQSHEIISIQYLQFWVRCFSIFAKDELNEKNVCSNNLYKYALSLT